MAMKTVMKEKSRASRRRRGGDDEGGGSGLRDDPEAALFDEHCDYKQMNLVALWDEETKTINIAGHVGKYLSGKSYGIWFNPEQTKSKPFTQRKYRPAIGMTPRTARSPSAGLNQGV